MKLNEMTYNIIFVNGEPFNCFQSMSLHDLLMYLEFNLERVVVEYNSQIVSKSNFNSIVFKDQDKLEIITIVGGG